MEYSEEEEDENEDEDNGENDDDDDDDDDDDNNDDDDDDDDDDDERRSREERREPDGRTDGRRARDTTTQPKLYARPRRAPETVLTNAPAYALARKHSRETQRGYEPHTGGDDTSRTHQPVRHLQPRSPRGRRIVRLYPALRRHEIRHKPSCGSGCRTTESRHAGLNGSDQLTAGPRAGWPVSEGIVAAFYACGAAASLSFSLHTAAVPIFQLEPRSDYWRVSAPRCSENREEGDNFGANFENTCISSGLQF